MSSNQIKGKSSLSRIAVRLIALMLVVMMAVGGTLALASCSGSLSQTKKEAISDMKGHVGEADKSVFTQMVLDIYIEKVNKAKNNKAVESLKQEYYSDVDSITKGETAIYALSKQLGKAINELDTWHLTVGETWQEEFTAFKNSISKTLGALDANDTNSIVDLLNQHKKQIEDLGKAVGSANTLIDTLTNDLKGQLEAETGIRASEIGSINTILALLNAAVEGQGQDFENTKTALLGALDAAVAASEAAIAASEARLASFIESASERYADYYYVKDNFANIYILFDDVHRETIAIKENYLTKAELQTALDSIAAKFDAIDERIDDVYEELSDAIVDARDEAMDYTDSELAAAVAELKELVDNKLAEGKSYTNTKVAELKSEVLTKFLDYVTLSKLSDELTLRDAEINSAKSEINTIKSTYTKTSDFNQLKNDFTGYVASNDAALQTVETALTQTAAAIRGEVATIKSDLETAIAQALQDATDHADALIGGANSAIGSINTTISNLDTTLRGLIVAVQSKANTNEQSINALDGRVGTLESSMLAAQSDITTLLSFKGVIDTWKSMIDTWKVSTESWISGIDTWKGATASWISDINSWKTSVNAKLAALEAVANARTTGANVGGTTIPPLYKTQMAGMEAVTQAWAYSSADYLALKDAYTNYSIAAESATTTDELKQAYEALQNDLSGITNQYDDVAYVGYDNLFSLIEYSLSNTGKLGEITASELLSALNAAKLAINQAGNNLLGIGNVYQSGLAIKDGVVSLNLGASKNAGNNSHFRDALAESLSGTTDTALGQSGNVLYDIAYWDAVYTAATTNVWTSDVAFSTHLSDLQSAINDLKSNSGSTYYDAVTAAINLLRGDYTSITSKVSLNGGKIEFATNEITLEHILPLICTDYDAYASYN